MGLRRTRCVLDLRVGENLSCSCCWGKEAPLVLWGLSWRIYYVMAGNGLVGVSSWHLA